jgi:hypothetical protein
MGILIACKVLQNGNQTETIEEKMEGFSFVTPITDLNRPNTGKEDEDDDLCFVQQININSTEWPIQFQSFLIFMNLLTGDKTSCVKPF